MKTARFAHKCPEGSHEMRCTQVGLSVRSHHPCRGGALLRVPAGVGSVAPGDHVPAAAALHTTGGGRDQGSPVQGALRHALRPGCPEGGTGLPLQRPFGPLRPQQRSGQREHRQGRGFCLCHDRRPVRRRQGGGHPAASSGRGRQGQQYGPGGIPGAHLLLPGAGHAAGRGVRRRSQRGRNEEPCGIPGRQSVHEMDPGEQPSFQLLAEQPPVQGFFGHGPGGHHL